MERCDSFVSPTGRLGFIVPVSSVSTDRYAALQKILRRHDHWYSNYDDRPCRLFEQLEHIRLSIHLLSPLHEVQKCFSTEYCRWNESERDILFDRLTYVPFVKGQIDGTLPKLRATIEADIIDKMGCFKSLANKLRNKGGFAFYYSRKIGSFTQVLDFMPEVYDSRNTLRAPSEFKELDFESKQDANVGLLGLNSSLFVWFCTVYSDCRHVNKREVEAFPLPFASLGDDGAVGMLAKKLMRNLRTTSEMREMGGLRIQCIIPRKCKPIIDEIDELLAKHYGFTEEELDFIINYDIKYRMGDKLNDAE